MERINLILDIREKSIGPKKINVRGSMTAGLEVKLETINLVSVEEPEIPAPDGAATPEPAKPAATK